MESHLTSFFFSYSQIFVSFQAKSLTDHRSPPFFTLRLSFSLKKGYTRPMKIKALFHGILTDWVGVSEAEILMPEEATLNDLLSRIRKDYGENMPTQLKTKSQEEFHQAFWAVRGSIPVNDPRAKLIDGEELRFFLPLAGG
jgi:molybdopterin converting factor small subunit